MTASYDMPSIKIDLIFMIKNNNIYSLKEKYNVTVCRLRLMSDKTFCTPFSYFKIKNKTY